MQTRPSLPELLIQETDRVEWKATDRDALQAVCALANDLGNTGRPAFLLLGVDNDGNVVGTDASDEAQQKLASRLRSIQLLPSPSVDIQVERQNGLELLVLTVAPYPVPPIVRLNQTAWVRIGTTTQRATEADLARLQERRPEGHLPFDLRPVPGATMDDLDQGRLRQEYLAARTTDAQEDHFPEFEAWLGQRDIVRRSGQEWTPTGAGLLTFGFAPHQFIPGALVEFARFRGDDFDSPVAERKTITGSIPHQLDSLWSVLNVNLMETLAVDREAITLYRPEYPLEALRELARNLLQHRIYEGTHAPSRVSWFPSRIIFSNPGSRFGRASEGEFGAHSDYRNPTLTRLLVEQGYVERLGRGIRLVRAQLERNGNPAMEVETDGFTTVTVRDRP